MCTIFLIIFFCSITEGFLIVASLLNPENLHFQETVYHYDYSGQIKGILPALGKGPHDFYSAYLPGDPGLIQAHKELPIDSPGWFVFFKDGYGGICCFRASTE